MKWILLIALGCIVVGAAVVGLVVARGEDEEFEGDDYKLRDDWPDRDAR